MKEIISNNFKKRRLNPKNVPPNQYDKIIYQKNSETLLLPRNNIKNYQIDFAFKCRVSHSGGMGGGAPGASPILLFFYPHPPLFKGRLSGLRQFLATESPSKIMKKCFLFHLFVPSIYQFLQFLQFLILQFRKTT